MRIPLLVIFTLLFAPLRIASAQWYDPASGQSPLVLMQVPEDGVAYFETKERARTLYEGGQWAQVEPLLEQLVRDYPRDPENWTLLGRTRFRLRKFREAAEAWERAGPLAGWDLEFSNGYRAAQAYANAGDRTAALALLRRMIFQQHGFWRQGLADWPGFATLKDDPEFREIIG